MTERPNLLLIVTDQQRGDCIGVDALAPDALQTPNLDFLANSGTRFARGYFGVSWLHSRTTPS
jgi:arylsulfatase A-like enzyme